MRRAAILLFFLGYLPLNAASPVRALLAENRIDDGVAKCRDLEAMAGADTDSQLACAWVYYRADKIEAGDRMMEKLSRTALVPEFQLLQVYARLKKKQFEEARRMVTALANEHRGGAFGNHVQEVSAELYEAQGQLDTAAFLYKQILTEDSNRGRVHWGLGRFYLGRGETARAKSHLEQVTKLWPKHLGARYNLAVMALGENDFPEAARWLANCYQLDRADVGVLEQLGVLFEKKKRIDLAIKYWQRAVNTNKDAPLAKEKLAQYHSQVVDSLADAKRYPEALEKLEASGKVKGDSSLILKRALLYRRTENFEKATGDFLSYLKKYPKDALAHRELGICYLNRKMVGQAAKSFLKAVSLEPKNGINYAWLAFVLESKGKLAEAKEAWQKAIEHLSEPQELEKATRRLATVEKKLEEKAKRKAEQRAQHAGEDPEDRDIEAEIQNMDVFEGVEGIPR